MKRRLVVHVTSAVFVCLLILSAAAQTPQPEPKLSTIVGCLVHGIPADATGERDRRTEPSAAASAKDYFVRTPTVALPVGTTVAIGKPGSSSTTPSAGTPAHDSFYRLTGLEPEQLRAHVGHRVEVQGHLNPDPETGTTARTTVDASGRPTTTVEQRTRIAGELRATTIKMVSASCS